MYFIKWAHNRVHCGSWPPAEQIVFSQQVDRHLLQSRGIDTITPQFCDSCLFVGGAISHFQRLGYRLPKRVLAISLWFTLSSAFKVQCRLCCDLGKEGFLKCWCLVWVKKFIWEEKAEQQSGAAKIVCWRLSLWQTVSIQPTLASKIT